MFSISGLPWWISPLQALSGCPLENLFQKKEVIVLFRPLLILLDGTLSPGQSVILALTLAINMNSLLMVPKLSLNNELKFSQII